MKVRALEILTIDIPILGGVPPAHAYGEYCMPVFIPISSVDSIPIVNNIGHHHSTSGD